MADRSVAFGDLDAYGRDLAEALRRYQEVFGDDDDPCGLRAARGDEYGEEDDGAVPNVVNLRDDAEDFTGIEELADDTEELARAKYMAIAQQNLDGGDAGDDYVDYDADESAPAAAAAPPAAIVVEGETLSALDRQIGFAGGAPIRFVELFTPSAVVPRRTIVASYVPSHASAPAALDESEFEAWNASDSSDNDEQAALLDVDVDGNEAENEELHVEVVSLPTIGAIGAAAGTKESTIRARKRRLTVRATPGAAEPLAEHAPAPAPAGDAAAPAEQPDGSSGGSGSASNSGGARSLQIDWEDDIVWETPLPQQAARRIRVLELPAVVRCQPSFALVPSSAPPPSGDSGAAAEPSGSSSGGSASGAGSGAASGAGSGAAGAGSGNGVGDLPTAAGAEGRAAPAEQLDAANGGDAMETGDGTGVVEPAQPVCHRNLAYAVEVEALAGSYHIRNADIERDAWLQQIWWNAPAKDFAAPLYIDLNDRQLLIPADQSAVSLKRHTPLDVSHDAFYEANQRKKLHLAAAGTPHSPYALRAAKLSWSLEVSMRRQFHRPRLHLHGQRPPLMTVQRCPIISVDRNDRQLRSARDLSIRSRDLVLTEYFERDPLLIMNKGMATRIKHHYRKVGQQTPDLPQIEGDFVELQPGDPGPFLGEVTEGRMVSGIVNDMFVAACARHQPRQTDFLLTLVRDGGATGACWLRRMPVVYVVAQEQPTREVPAPNSRLAKQIAKDRMTSYAVHITKHGRVRPSVPQLRTMFPEVSEGTVRRHFYADAENLSKLEKVEVAPEDVCAYESMNEGMQRLEDYSIHQRISVSAMEEVVDRIRDKPTLEVARALLEECISMPWYLSHSYNFAKKGRSTMVLEGVGDPSGCGLAFSYHLIPQRGSSLRDKDKRAETKIVPKGITGTAADLRKLTMPELNELMVNYGCSPEEIAQLDRWQKVGFIRSVSTKITFAGQKDAAKFARGTKQSLHQQAHENKLRIQRIFDGMLAAIARTGAGDDADDSDTDSELDEIRRAANDDRGPSSTVARIADNRAQHVLEERKMRQDIEAFSEQIAPDDNRVKQMLESMLSSDWSATERHLEDTPERREQAQGAVLRRVVLTRHPNGTIERRVELIRDPQLIAGFRHFRDDLEQTKSSAEMQAALARVPLTKPPVAPKHNAKKRGSGGPSGAHRNHRPAGAAGSNSTPRRAADGTPRAPSKKKAPPRPPNRRFEEFNRLLASFQATYPEVVRKLTILLGLRTKLRDAIERDEFMGLLEGKLDEQARVATFEDEEAESAWESFRDAIDESLGEMYD